jgi:hypothetical protein
MMEKINDNEKKPWKFCETPEEKCTMNYCDDNGCMNRTRHLVEFDPRDRPQTSHK